jgi:hypothetical protein
MLKTILLFIFLAASLLRADEFPFIGLAVSAQQIDIRTDNSSAVGFDLRVGKQTVEWRTLFAYSYSSDYQSLSTEIDKIILDDLFNTAKVRPYFGLSAGLLKIDGKHLDDNKGYYYGANLGLIFYAADSMDIDLSYHYQWISSIDHTDHMQGATLGLHYFF